MRNPDEAGIFIEVAIKGKSMCDAQPFHNDEARTVNKAEEVVGIIPKCLESLSNIDARKHALGWQPLVPGWTTQSVPPADARAVFCRAFGSASQFPPKYNPW